MVVPFIDLKKQFDTIRTEISQAIECVLEESAFIKGKFVEVFEKNFADEHNIRHCIGVGNGTDAITIALKAFGIKHGEEVITVANSFIASAEAITNTGAKVVFIDCDPRTYNINTLLIEEKITSNTKAILPVHLYGQPADMDSIMKLAGKYNLLVIEDTAQAHLAEYLLNDDDWKRAGTIGNAAAFSFFPGKNLGAFGDAGAILTNSDDVARYARMYANHGRISKYDHEFEGVNSRLDSIQAAILNVKLKYLHIWTQRRQHIANYYSRELKDIPEIIIPFVDEKTRPVWHLYVIRTTQRNKLIKYLDENGIETGIHYPIALPNLKAYSHKKHLPSDFPVASAFQNEVLSLPIFPEMSELQVEYVIEKIKKYFIREN